MPVDADFLPDDIEALKALLRQRDGELQQLRDTVSTLVQALSVRALEIEQLHLLSPPDRYSPILPFEISPV
jgi:hypothetical protein